MSLAGDIAHYYGQGKEEKNADGWLTFCPVHGNTNTPALAVTDKEDGDVKVYCHGNSDCTFKQIKDRFRADGVLPEWKPGNKTGTQTAAHKAPKKKSSKPNFIWKKPKAPDSEKHIKGYFATRAIALDPVPKSFKLNSYKDKETKEDVNVILAAVSKPGEQKVETIHRLFLDINNEYARFGKWKLLGDTKGKGIWFDRKGDMATITLGEGIETTLSAMQAMNMNGAATISTSGMKSLIFPEETETIYILVDSDPVREKQSMPGQKAAYTMAEKFQKSREGRQALLVTPDDTCFSDNPKVQDFNDLLKADPTGEGIRSRFKKAVEFDALEWEPPGLDREENETPTNDVSAEQAMFERFVFLASENKIIDTIGHDIKESMMVERAFIHFQAGHFHHYEDENGKQKAMPLTKYWLESDNKQIASSLQYKPGSPLLFENGDGRNYYNTYRLPYQLSPVIPEKELISRLINWHKIMDAVFHKHRSYIEDWFSFSIQQPQERTGIMPVCISGVGLGKSLVMAIISRVIGHQNFSNGKILDVTGLGRTGTQWGDWIFNKKISCIEEIDPEGETGLAYKILDALKDIITNETLSLNLKGGRNGTFPVYANIIGFSNHKNCVKIPYGDRRLFIVDSTGQALLSSDEYKEIWGWMRDEANIIAVYQYLLNRKISEEFIPGQAKMTTAKKGLQIDGRSDLQTAFDLVAEQYPSDLVTPGELQLAVSQALHYIEGGEGVAEGTNWNADKQYKAILRTTTSLAAGGKRLRAQRVGGNRLPQSRIRAIRNGQMWSNATNQEIVDAMYVETPLNWIKEEEDDTAPF